MKNHIKIFLWMFLSFSISSELFSQSVTLIGDAKLSLMGEGVIFSAPSVKLKGNSQIIHAEKIKLGQSEYIQMLSPDALLKTRILLKGEKAVVPAGIDSKADVSIVNRSAPMAFSIGMEKLNEPESLPFFWKLSSLSSDDQEGSADVKFSWTKAAEPQDFKLKSVVRKDGLDWLLEYSQEIQETVAQLRNYSRLKAESSAFTISNNTLDTDGDGVPDIQEIKDGTDPLDPNDYKDADGDGVPDYIEELEGSDLLDPVSYLDSNQDGVPDYIRDRSPIMFINTNDIMIPWGFNGIDSMLPDSLIAVLGSGEIRKLHVLWDKSNLKIFTRGNYQILGKYNLYPGVFNAYKLPSDITVTVLPKPAPTNILLSNNTFEGAKTSQEVAIGSLTVVDPVDNRHVLGLPHGLEDNRYFRVINDVLYWSSEDPAAGRTIFKIVVRVTDRDFNTLDRVFEITRNRERVSDIVIYNTFTPEGDGVNDTWGVLELRYYKGVRIQVFERSGKRVFYTENPDIRWDGTHKGKELPIGTYYWTIEVRETGEVRRGMLNLLRK